MKKRNLLWLLGILVVGLFGCNNSRNQTDNIQADSITEATVSMSDGEEKENKIVTPESSYKDICEYLDRFFSETFKKYSIPEDFYEGGDAPIEMEEEYEEEYKEDEVTERSIREIEKPMNYILSDPIVRGVTERIYDPRLLELFDDILSRERKGGTDQYMRIESPRNKDLADTCYVVKFTGGFEQWEITYAKTKEYNPKPIIHVTNITFDINKNIIMNPKTGLYYSDNWSLKYGKDEFGDDRIDLPYITCKSDDGEIFSDKVVIRYYFNKGILEFNKGYDSVLGFEFDVLKVKDRISNKTTDFRLHTYYDSDYYSYIDDQDQINKLLVLMERPNLVLSFQKSAGLFSSSRVYTVDCGSSLNYIHAFLARVKVQDEPYKHYN